MPPDFFRVPVLAREYMLDLQAWLSATAASGDALLLETLAFAEGRLLSIHPFADFNGRLTRVWLREILCRLDLPPVRLVADGPQETADYLAALRAGRTPPLQAMGMALRHDERKRDSDKKRYFSGLFLRFDLR